MLALKKYMALLLTIVFISGLLPSHIVFANLQNPVIDLSITDTSDNDSSTYSFTLKWSKPQISSKPDMPAVQAYRDAAHHPLFYSIYQRNATKSEAYPNTNIFKTPDLTDTDYPKDYSVPLANLTLAPGSIFVFKSTPFHQHYYPASPTDRVGDAPLDLTSSRESEVLYLTDINVNAKGSGNQMTVTWDNPLFDGKEVFSGYRIYYSLGGSSLVTVPDTLKVDVYSDDPDLIRTSDGRLRYTFSSDNLEIGKFYAIKVEPLVGNVDLRSGVHKVTINDRSYDITYTNPSREYRTDEAYIEPSLFVVAEGLDYIRLFWPSFKGSIENVQSLDIYRFDNKEGNNGILIGSLAGSESAQNINFVSPRRPATTTWYRYIIRYLNSSGEQEKMESEIREFNPSYVDFDPYKPTILKLENSIDISWLSFMRAPYNTDEEGGVSADFGGFIDKALSYQIWVTDDLNNLDSSDPGFYGNPIATLSAAELSEFAFIDEKGVEKPAYNTSITQYLSWSSVEGDTAFVKKDLEANKVYYFKIVATRLSEDGEQGQQSQPAYGSYFIPPKDDVSQIPIGISTPPLRIRKDTNGADVIDEQSIDIEWATTWFEGYVEDDKKWYSRIGITTSSALIFGEKAKTAPKSFDLSESIYTDYYLRADTAGGIAKIEADLIGAGASADEVGKIAFRAMDLKDASYEIHTVPYDYMAQSTDPDVDPYEVYLNTINNPENDALWTQITPTASGKTYYYTVTNENLPTNEDLKPNTAYVIFFRPYVVKDGKKSSYYPAYVTGTTLDARGPVDIVPTVPILEVDSVTDLTATVKWPYSSELEYELAYAENISSYPDNGISIPWATILEDGVVREENGKDYMYYTIDTLFPDTEYYIWIRSSANNSTGVAYSAWSNPASVRTLDIAAPKPPNGLGLASKEYLDAYNKEKKTAYTNIDADSMVIEWMRNSLDTEAAGTSGTIEDGNAEVLDTQLAKPTYMVRFPELKGITRYYIRAKTILTVTKADIGVTRNYNYVLEFADNPEFKDAVVVTVPPIDVATEALDPSTTLRKESEWGAVLSFVTGQSDDEYERDDKLYPLPERDYEISPDTTTDTLNFRFRSNKTDAGGNRDNNVDQRFISRLINNRLFTYELDLSTYKGEYFTTRELEIPYSIYSAFDQRKISLKVTADNLSVTLPPGSLNTSQVKALGDFGKDAIVKLVLREAPKDAPMLTNTESYVSKPHKLTLQVITPSRTVAITNLAVPAKVDLKLNSRNSVLDKNVGTYIADANTVGWERTNSSYDNVLGLMSFDTVKVVNYGAISRNLPFASTAEPEIINNVYNVSTRIDIKDMSVFDPKATISANQFNNLVAAVAKGSLSVSINGDLSDSDYASMSKAGILVAGSNVTREAGVHALVRLYENKTKTGIKNYGSANDTAYPDINAADPRYTTSMLKAESIGFLDKYQAADPKGSMTFEDVFYMLDIVISDAGI